MAEKLRLQRVRSFYQLAGPGPFVSNPFDVSSVGSKRPHTIGFHVSSAKTHERTGSHLSKRMPTAYEFNRRRRNSDTPRNLEYSQPVADLRVPPCKCSREATSTNGGGDASENLVTAEIIRPKRLITVVLPSLHLMDDEDNTVALDTHDGHAPFSDAERDCPMRNGVSNLQQNRIDDQRSVTTASDDPARLGMSDRKKSAMPVYRLRYVHFDKNRAAVGHARQVADRLFAISLQRQASAFSRIELA